MLSVVSRQGSGLLHVTDSVLEQFARMHGRRELDANGIWRVKFDLDMIEQLVVQRLVSTACKIQWTPLRRLFMYKPKQRSAAVLGNMATLNSALPSNFTSARISEEALLELSQGLKPLSFPDTLQVLQGLAMVSEILCDQVQSSEDERSAEKLADTPFNEFFETQGLSGNALLLHLCSGEELRLKHTGALYQVCEEHLQLHEYLFQGLPNLLCQKLEPALVAAVTENFTARLKLASDDPGSLVQAGETSIDTLQSTVNLAQDKIDQPLFHVLKSYGFVDDDDLLAVFAMPEVCCCHLKSVLVLLLQFVQKARTRQLQVDTAELDNRTAWTEQSALEEATPSGDLGTEKGEERRKCRMLRVITASLMTSQMRKTKEAAQVKTRTTNVKTRTPWLPGPIDS